MQIDKIISMANSKVQLRFLAMERSLRATGCQLPIWVIPYDEDLFELPQGSKWWKIEEVCQWLKQQKAHSKMKKYQCLFTSHYQFVDADVCFLKNPQETLQPYTGFVTSCGHWHNPEHTYTKESQMLMQAHSTIWPKNVFNSGQFASDTQLFTWEKFKTIATNPQNISTILQCPWHEQPGFNLLVFHSGIKVTNLTLPPICMESTWAGDYLEENYKRYWQNPKNKPYLIHWAGVAMDIPYTIHEIFYQFLTAPEKQQWQKLLIMQKKHTSPLRIFARRLKRAWEVVLGKV